MVSVALVIQAVREQAAMLELGELSPAIVDAGKALGDLRRDLLEDRSRQEEVSSLLRLLVEDLLARKSKRSLSVVAVIDWMNSLRSSGDGRSRSETSTS